ncbi:MAG: peptidyl-prolyl cis-trans isomerase [Candidatus Omnitrophota bacterium]
MNKIIIAVIIVVATALSGCGNSSPILARINNKIITLKEFEKRISKLPAKYQSTINKRKGDYLNNLIEEELLFEEAKKRHLEYDSEMKDLLLAAKKKILISKLIEDEMNKGVVVTDEDAEHYYNLHKDEFVEPERISARHILVGTSEEAKALLKEIKNGKDFAEAAREKSLDSSKVNGGDIGYFTKGQMIPEFEDACFRLQPGEISDVIKSPLGFHIIRLNDRIPGKNKNFEEVKEDIKNTLLTKKRKVNLDKLMGSLKKSVSITINEKLLAEDDEKKQE